MEELSIIIEALECIWEWMDNKDREPDKAIIYKSMIKKNIRKLKEINDKRSRGINEMD